MTTDARLLSKIKDVSKNRSSSIWKAYEMQYNLPMQLNLEIETTRFSETSLVVFSNHPGVHFGRDSSVGIATRYGFDGPEIESR